MSAEIFVVVSFRKKEAKLSYSLLKMKQQQKLWLTFGDFSHRPSQWKNPFVAKSLVVVSEAVKILKFQLFLVLDLDKICYVFMYYFFWISDTFTNARKRSPYFWIEKYQTQKWKWFKKQRCGRSPEGKQFEHLVRSCG